MMAKLCDNDDCAFEWRLKAMEEKVKSLENKLWAIILLLITNLAGIIGIFIGGAWR